MADDKTRYVNLSKSSGNWADEEPSAPVEKKPMTWGKVEEVKAVSIADQLQADKKDVPRSSNEAAPRSSGRDEGAPPSRNYREERGDYAGGDYDRAPRERNPLPDSPPWNAFIGNLSYEVAEEQLWDYFGDLGVKSVRLIRDAQTGKAKGFGYIEFETRDGLENALQANNQDFFGRRLNVDAAAPKKDAFGSGPSGPGGRRYGNFGDRGGFGDRGFGSSGFGDRSGGDRYGDRGGDRGYTRGGFSRPAERPKLDLLPRTKPLDSPAPSAGDASSDASKAAPTGADPFGGANANIEKMNQIAADRLKREQEREQRARDELKAKEERRQREREERESAAAREPRRGPPASREPPKSDKEREIGSKSSWRSNKRPDDAPSSFSSPRGGYGGRGRGDYQGSRGGRGGGNGGARGSQQGGGRWVEGEDGFKTKSTKGGAEESPAKSSGGSWANVAKGASKEESGAGNQYEALGGEQ